MDFLGPVVLTKGSGSEVGEMGQPTLWTGIAHARKEITAVGVISANNSQTSGKYEKMRAQRFSQSHSCPLNKRATFSTKVNPI